MVLSIPIKYHLLLCYINCHITHHYAKLGQDDFKPKAKRNRKTSNADKNALFKSLHLYCYLNAIRETFLFEVIHAHSNGEMAPKWESKTLHEYMLFIAACFNDAVLERFKGILAHPDAAQKAFIIQQYGEAELANTMLSNAGECPKNSILFWSKNNVVLA